MEVDVAWDDFISHAPEGDWADMAPFRILSFDIECAGRKGIFPEPEKDPVIQIANMVIRQVLQLARTVSSHNPIFGYSRDLSLFSPFDEQGESEPFIKNVLTLDTCGQIVGSDVIPCKTESQLLETWAEFVRQADPDLITGYNIGNFDLPYLLNRAKHLTVRNFHFLGRCGLLTFYFTVF